MSTATGTPDHQSLLAERYGPPVGGAAALPEPSRSSVVAALHAIAYFFVDNIDVPQPRYAAVNCLAANRAELEQLAAAHNTVVYGDRPQVSIRLAVGPEIYATVIVALPAPDRPL
jgi:hypothetical protein